MDAQNHLAGLNERQKEAVLSTEGPLLILAGAGAGKTKTITHRILHIIKSEARPSAILAITFTNKAASEMRERVMALLDADRALNRPVSMDEAPFVSTFHSLGVKIIKDNAEKLNLPRHFSIFDRADSKQAVKNAMLAIEIDSKEFEPGKVLHVISRQKGDGVSAGDFAAREVKNFFEDIVSKVWIEYEKILAKEKALDFDDLLLKALALLRDKKVAEKYWSTWKYIHIDEYQDTNKVQYDIAKRLAEKHKNIVVVGDIDQCLIAGTEITLRDGSKKPIEKIKTGDEILSNYGSGDYRGACVTEVFTKTYEGDTITITTSSGKQLTSTPEHTHFAGFKLGPSAQRYFTYLMYKQEKGFRLGVSQTYTKGQKKPMLGFTQRCNQEHGDKLWVIASHNNPNSARILEYSLSMRFGIPTIPFVARKGIAGIGNGIIHDQKIIDGIFKTCNTEVAGQKLIEEYGLDQKHPHHSAQSKNSNRRNITLTLCGDHRGKTPMHRIAMVGNDIEGRKKLERLGFSVRSAKANSSSWRFETAHSDYNKLMDIVARVASVFSNLEIIRNARLGGVKSNPKNGNSLPFLPAASLVPGMIIFDEKGAFDVVEKVERKSMKTKVYDLNIEKTHNFVANGIVTHNSIYSWRGADFKNIMRFEKDYPNAKTILLEENYRSTKTILSAANSIIAKNVIRKDKNLFTQNKDGDMISLYIAFDERDEAGTIAEKTASLIREGASADEVSVLYRANFQSRVLEEAFLRRNIPYELVGTKFFERKEVRDALSYIKASLNPDSLSDLKRILNTPSRGIGKVTMLKIFEGKESELADAMKRKVAELRQILREIKVAAEKKLPSEAVKFAIKRSGLEGMLMNDKEEGAERLENVRELVSTAQSYDMYGAGEGVEKFLEHSALATDQDELGRQKGVKLMTVHASKGLEFEHVFITGLEQDLFPHEKMNEDEMSAEDKEEERRLFYVALTRAKEKLHLSYAQTRTIYGARQINMPSEFLADIDDSLMHLENPGAEKMMKYIEF